MRSGGRKYLGFIALCMAAVMAFGVASPAGVHANGRTGKEYSVDGLKWGFDKSTGTITAIPEEWKGGDLPSEFDGTKVTKIGDKAGRSHRNIRTLTIPEGVTEIGEQAFSYCYYMEYLKLPASLEKIGARGFHYCDQLEVMEFAGDRSKIKCDENATGEVLCHHPDFSDSYKSGEYYQKLMNVKLTGDLVADAFAIAASQEGYHQGNSVDELDGSNREGTKNYAEMGYYRDAVEWMYFPDNYEEEYWGGWCGMFVEWVYDMAGAPEAVMDVFNWKTAQQECTYDTTVYAGGTREFKHGDMVHFDKGHYMMVDKVEFDEENDRLTIWSWNGNPDVHYTSYEFEASTGTELADSGNGTHRKLNFFFPVDVNGAKTVPTVKLTFDPAGGKTDVTEKTVYEEAKYGLLPVPVKEGYVFDGWYTGRSGKGHLVSAYRTVRITKDRTLYAKWVDANGNVWQDPNETGKEELELYPEPPETSERREAYISADKTELSQAELKEEEQTVIIHVSGSEGDVTAKNKSAGKRKKQTAISINGRDVYVTFRKGAKKGTYKFKINVTAYGDYAQTAKTVKIKVK